MNPRHDNSEESQIFKNFLTAHWHDSKPMARLFKTDSHNYLYDTGTNKILKCHPLVFDLLECLLSKDMDTAIHEYLETHENEAFAFAADMIMRVMSTEKILLLTKVKMFGISDDFAVYEKMIDSSLDILFLEVTEKCTLRCKYCLYNDSFDSRRNHSKNSMNREVAFRAIDYLKAHSYKRKETSISFFGGEPLLEIQLIKDCVEYAQSTIIDKKIVYALTTNGELLTPEIAGFLNHHRFKVSVSLDGPQEIHDSCRVDIKGEGGYYRVVRGLKFLKDAYGDSFKDDISINMVYTPPFSVKKLDRMAQLWDNASPWLPGLGRVTITYPAKGSILPELFPDVPVPEDKGLQQWSFEKYLQAYTGTGESSPMANGIIERGLAQLIQRPIAAEPITSYSLNGCCIPGVNRIFVTTAGNFQLCERINSDAPLIGDVHNGIYLQTIESIYIQSYRKLISQHCSECWAVGLCSACYTDVFTDGELDFEKRRLGCFQTQKTLDRFMTYYCTLQEINPQGLKYLYDYNITE